MSNYRVRQVIALGKMPERQRMLLIALATFMHDDDLAVRVSVDALMKTAGLSRNTFRSARRELEEGGRIRAVPGGHGSRDVTTWTVSCLPAQGVNALNPLSQGVNESDPLQGVSRTSFRGSTERHSGGQPKSADQAKRDRWLNRMAKDSLSSPGDPLLTLLRESVPDAEMRELSELIGWTEAEGKVRNVRAYLRAAFRNGDGPSLIAEVRTELAERDARNAAACAWCGKADGRHTSQCWGKDKPRRTTLSRPAAKPVNFDDFDWTRR